MKTMRFRFVLLFICVFSAFPLTVLAETVTEEWAKRYNGSANGYDQAAAIAVDGAGNVYVTGGSYRGEVHYNYDYLTVKYDSNGNELWATTYNGPGNTRNWANAIAVDDAGNVYVTGESDGGEFNFDYATIKYDTNGNELWVKRYNGTGNGRDYASTIAIDGAGNSYVTGRSSGGISYMDYATIKYDTNGNELWVKRFNGPGNGRDHAYDIALDDAGNTYVTGYSDHRGYNGDYATVKYDINGNELWAKIYNGPANSSDGGGYAIAVDGAGNSYVTGSSMGSGSYVDYATIKYDTNGNELWVKRYNGTGNFYDAATGIAVNDVGDSYVTGHSYSTGSGDDYATIKYDTNGNELWVKRYNGYKYGEDRAAAIVIDNSGNAYVTGRSSWDYATVKYDTNGNELWVKKYGFNIYARDMATAIAVDGAGNTFVTGYSHSSGAYYDYATIKYSSGPIDTDGDGVLDISDNCVNIPNPDQSNHDTDSMGDACDSDDDNDEKLDGQDNCPLVHNPDQIDSDNDGIGDVCDGDMDGDGVNNNLDNCPAHSNPDQTDTDKDGAGDECDTNDDNDQHLDINDNCPTIINDDQADMDGDSVGNVCDIDIDGDGKNNDMDNCPVTANSGQDDADADGEGDACDIDDDNDGYLDEVDNCQFIPNDQSDQDEDGKGDVCDADLDGDGIDNETDNCPVTPNNSQRDTDNDGLGDACDPDIDGDGVDNDADLCADTPQGEIIDPSSGCTIAQLCPCDAPQGTTTQWRNHGKYISCTSRTSESFVALGLITDANKDVIVSAAAESNCGHKK